MKPTLLKAGDKVVTRGYEMTFLRREKVDCRRAVNWFQCEEFRGIGGPEDDGKCTMTDYRVSKFVERKSV